LKMALKIRVCY